MKKCTNCGVIPTNTMLTDGLCVVCQITREHDGLKAERDRRLVEIEILSRTIECIERLTAERDALRADYNDIYEKWQAAVFDLEESRADVERLRAQVPVWISVDEQAPPNYSDILVTDGQTVSAAIVNLRGEICSGTAVDEYDITHWQPRPSMSLPAAPGTNESENQC